MGSNNSFYTTAESSFGMVVKFSQHFERPIVCISNEFCSPHDRCIDVCMGRSYWESSGSRSVVLRRKELAHKLSRAGGCHSVSETLSTQTERSVCVDTVRQHHSGAIHQQTRGNQVLNSLSESTGTLADIYPKPNRSQKCSYCRLGKCSCGSVIKNTDKRDRMVSEPVDTSSNLSDMGVSVDRSICISTQSQTSCVLFMDSPSSSICDRCSLNFVGEHVCVCLPTSMPHTKSTGTCADIPVSSDSDCTTVATTPMVSSVTTTTHSKSNSNSKRSKSSKTTKNKDLPSKPRTSQSSCMAHIKHSFRSKGFSKRTEKLLMASWRSGTRKDYKVKFKQYNSWCTERNVNPYSATLVQIADFLTHLFHKGLQYRTIAGYRSMLSTVVNPVDNKAVGQHPYIIRLIKGVFNSRPPVKKLVPEWDLSLVLEAIQKAPFEPMKTVHLKYATWKTVLLLAITSFRRCSDLHSLKIGEGSVNVTSQGITFIRHGLSKTDRQNHISPTVFIPAFIDNRKLDPRRTLKIYLERTHNLRTDDEELSSLFISYVKPHKPVSTQTLSKWIVLAIKSAYQEMGKDLDGKIRAHSTRSISTSWALFNGAAMKSILEAADWSRQSTFTRFYLKNVQNVNTQVLQTAR